MFKASLGGLPFELLADWMRTVTASFGVLREDKGTARRSVFVVDRDLRIVYHNTAFEAGNRAHYDAVLDQLRALREQGR